MRRLPPNINFTRTQMPQPSASKTPDLNPQEQGFYDRFRDAHETYAKSAWELECLSVELKRSTSEKETGPLAARQAEVDRTLQKNLEGIKSLVQEVTATLGQPKKFGKETVGIEGLAGTIQKRIERDILDSDSKAYPYITRMALLGAFLEREKTSRASIYKKRFRSGFRGSSESLIKEELQKNEAWREERYAKYADRLTPKDTEMLKLMFKVHMARHGNERQALES